MQQKIFCGLFLFFCLVPWMAESQQIKAPGLGELILAATVKDYQLANRNLDIEATKIDRQKLQEAYLPRVDVSGQGGFMLLSFTMKTPEIRIPALNVDIKSDRNTYTITSGLFKAGADASMLLYSGGKIPLLKKAVDEKVKSQTEILERDVQKIISDIVMAYDQLALLKQIRLVLRESERRLGEDVRISDKSFSYGLITKYDHEKILVAQAQLSSRIVEYEGKRGLVLEQLHLLTDIDHERLALIDQDLIPFKTSVFPDNIENRPELKAIDAAILAQQFQVKAEKTWFVPKIQASGSLGYVGILAGHLNTSRPVLPGGKNLSTSLPNINALPLFNIGVGFKWSVFDGREGRRQVQKAEIELKQALNDKKDLIEKLKLNLANCNSDIRIANAKVAVGERQREIAGNALDQATREFRTGLIRSSDLIDAEDDFQQAALDYAQALYNQRRATIALLKATGNLTIQSIQ